LYWVLGPQQKLKKPFKSRTKSGRNDKSEDS
jgi:hypothetical protein